MPADPILKELYPDPVAQPEQQSAEDTFIDKVSSALEEQEIDFDTLTEQEKDEVIDAALEQEQAQVAGSPEAEATKEAEAKFVEADTMGRVMAHSFNQELGEIELEKGAAKPKPSARANLKAALAAKMTKGQRAASAVRPAIRAAVGPAGSTRRKIVAALAKRKGLLGAGAAVGAAGAGGYALGKRSADEQAEAEFGAAVDEAATDQAAELLAELGITPDQLPE